LQARLKISKKIIGTPNQPIKRVKELEYAKKKPIEESFFVLMLTFLSFFHNYLLSIYDSNESIDFVRGKTKNFYWSSGRIGTFHR
jgi:hypothetical protein